MVMMVNDHGGLHEDQEIVCKCNGNVTDFSLQNSILVYFLALSTLIMYMYWKFSKVLSAVLAFGCLP